MKPPKIQIMPDLGGPIPSTVSVQEQLLKADYLNSEQNQEIFSLRKWHS